MGLRTGVTTGICAAAAAKAAAMLLLSSNPTELVEIAPKVGKPIAFEIINSSIDGCCATCAFVKYAGDDPDVTDGIRIIASVAKSASSGINVDGGDGVGRVTKPGLKAPVGKAAINPVPMEMITAAIREICVQYGYEGGIDAVISIPSGADIAKKTMNERLGVVGGLSILGTTGIVEPMSERAIIETIKAEIDVHAASGNKILIMTPGNYGKDFTSESLGLSVDDAVRCSNFIGEALDYACTKEFEKITLIGHAGKLVKLAGGVMNTHSSIADCRLEIIAAHSALSGADTPAISKIMDSATTKAAIDVLECYGIREPVWESIGKRIGFHLKARTKSTVCIEYIVFTQEHGILTRGVT